MPCSRIIHTVVRILFLQKRLLLPSDTGGKIRTLNVLRHLAKWHEVTYLCNLQKSEHVYIEEMRAIGVDLRTIPWVEAPRRSLRFLAFAVQNLFSKYPLTVDKDYDPKLRRTATELALEGTYDLLICDFVQMAKNCLHLSLPKLLFQHNVESEVLERLSQRSTGPWAWYLRQQARRMRRFESVAGADFDCVLAVSRRDQQQFQERYHWNHVKLIDTAVDTDYYSASVSKPESKLATKVSNVIFVGSMDWPPNREGVQHFVKSIWPRVLVRYPHVKFTIVGRNPPASILDLERNPGVSVTGTVSDTRPYINSASISVVPLYSGGGTRLKIFEAMAMKSPVVSTTIGAEGLEVTDGEHLLIRDTEERIAEAVCDLITDSALRERLSLAGYQLVHDRYTSEIVAKQFEQHCLDTVTACKERKSGAVQSND